MGEEGMSSEFVRLEKDSLFEISQAVGKQYLLDLDVERLLAPIYEGASQTKLWRMGKFRD